MAQEQRSNVTIDVCEAHGVWLDKSELMRITEHERQHTPSPITDLFHRFQGLFKSTPSLPSVDPKRRLMCPVSGQEMTVIEYKQVHIDHSPEHGVWLDCGELETIISNLRSDPFYLRGIAIRVMDAQL